MARIRQKEARRYRVQFTMSKQLWDKYQRNLKLAEELRAEIDFAQDFETWFARQNEQVEHDLSRLRSDIAKHSCVPTARDNDTHGVD